MNKSVVVWLMAIVSLVASGNVCPVDAQNASADQWARWRGPTGNGIADSNQRPPVEWSDGESTVNVVWKAEVPGRGHASPIVLGNRIFLATSERAEQVQSVLCYDRETGKQLWATPVNEGGFAGQIHGKNTHASSTIATDGQRVFAVFSHHDRIELTSLSLDGEVLWTKNVGPYNPAYPFGFGASPIVYDSMVIVTNENRVEGGLTAYNTETGEQIWKIDREGVSSYSTPVVTEIAGKNQLLISGGKAVASYDPKTGKQNWKTPASWIVTCGTLVWDGDLVFASGGFPQAQTIAIDASNGKEVWSNRTKAYEQSMLAHDGYLYSLTDNGVIYCWRAADGKEMWSQRFSAPVSASPTLVNGNLYFTAESGRTVVVKAEPSGYQEVARNQLGDSAFATPAFCGNQIFTRVGVDGQEFLYCLGDTQASAE